ncbi:MAG: thiosulfate oxidation carrier protein SoxY [Gammaproteobacteria bacterium]
MIKTRRIFLQQCLAFAAGILSTPLARAVWPAEKFAELKFPESLARYLDGQPVTPSEQIQLKLPQIAENGAVVPISVDSALDNVESIAILVEKNFVPLVAQFDLSPDCAAFVSARIKMAETGNVVVLVKAGGRYYSAQQLVKVTIGGCGG